MLLSKGFEVEIYTCTPTGDAVGFSDQIVADLQGFVREPDSRNVEYTTPPLTKYELLCIALLEPRRQLRQYLRSLGDYTVMPGSTLALGGSESFHRSDPQNPYHGYIENTYGTKVVTASIHINVGIPNTEDLIRACRLVRMEAALYLALSASSPFLNGEVTGSHSTRWQMFPKTPIHVPLFSSHRHFIDWTNHQIQLGVMQNVRHLWSAVRPNGDNRPYDLNRLELRICDLVIDPLALLAITTLLEMRLQMLLADQNLDPLLSKKFSPDELMAIADQNEISAARNSLDAELINWETGEKVIARDWIWNQYHQVKPRATAQGVSCFLSPLEKILNQGNEAQRWLAQVGNGLTPREVLTTAIAEVAAQEQDLANNLLS
ncbi:glutamate--cysteine ligase, cyanobacterial, putative [Synechococcus sp. PCC 7502]|uniref:glutamate--cysteine ligase n=1 Tax=Synechococcus sp. PCC 7502 TaxID=1173263 RepID=UPI00029FD7DB|nr:glutamate--cysteine ligase [Synechococcus sp. PCC 7502]AFY73926.1 glutamate--cysteine ligase, cyanobacterial, putative [Synechococcus sp. PCC 7502]